MIRLDLARRCAGFIVKCLNSSNDVERSVATHGVYVCRMRSPVDHNAQHCAAAYDVSVIREIGYY